MVKHNQNLISESELDQVVIMDLSKDSTTGKTTISSIYSPTMYPALTITTNNISRKINVVFVSTEAEEKEHLYHKVQTHFIRQSSIIVTEK